MGRDEQLPGSEEWLPRRCIYYQWICTGNFTQACLISVRVLGIKVLWNVTPCRWACRSRHIGRTYFLRLRGSGGHSIISFIVIPWIRTGLQNSYGYGNNHIFRNQRWNQHKSVQQSHGLIQYLVSAQYKIFRMIKYTKIVACTSKLQCAEYE